MLRNGAEKVTTIQSMWSVDRFTPFFHSECMMTRHLIYTHRKDTSNLLSHVLYGLQYRRVGFLLSCIGRQIRNPPHKGLLILKEYLRRLCTRYNFIVVLHFYKNSKMMESEQHVDCSKWKYM